MSITQTTKATIEPFTQRDKRYPSAWVYGVQSVVGDASGGNIKLQFTFDSRGSALVLARANIWMSAPPAVEVDITRNDELGAAVVIKSGPMLAGRVYYSFEWINLEKALQPLKISDLTQVKSNTANGAATTCFFEIFGFIYDREILKQTELRWPIR